MSKRRKNYDVTDSVDVSDHKAVLSEVSRIVSALYPDEPLDLLRTAFADFDRMFRGEDPEFLGCDTPYHDIQHSLDVCLATARLFDGFERSVPASRRMGPRRMVIGTIVALFHDCGYIRESSITEGKNGSIFTKTHVRRGGEFLRGYLPKVAHPEDGDIAAELIHYTGFERSVEGLGVPDQEWVLSGYMVGTADLIAQMADRCYLEKCRDYLYPEFVVGGEDRRTLEDGTVEMLYQDAEELLRKTPLFYQFVVEPRLDEQFEKVYQHAGTHFGGSNLYMSLLHKNLDYLKVVLDADDFSMLRRKPVCYLAEGEDFDPDDYV